MTTAEHQYRYRCLVFGGQKRLRPQAGRSVNLHLVRHPQAAAALSSRERLLLDLAFDANGLSASHYRSEALARRLPALLRFLRAQTVDEGIRRLQGHPQKRSSALNVLLIGTTAFFRDLAPFSWLEREVVPQLGEGRQTLWVWSVGTSTGQELVSVALIFGAPDCLNGPTCGGVTAGVPPSSRRGAEDSRNGLRKSSQQQIGYGISPSPVILFSWRRISLLGWIGAVRTFLRSSRSKPPLT